MGSTNCLRIDRTGRWLTTVGTATSQTCLPTLCEKDLSVQSVSFQTREMNTVHCYNYNRLKVLALLIALLSATSVSAQETAAVDSLAYSGPAWSPYLVGALIGVLSMFTFYFSNKALGASSAYAAVAGKIGMAIAPKHTRSLKYYQDNPPKLGWEVALVFSVIVGAFVAAWSGGEITAQLLPEMWQDRFASDSGSLRLATAFLGGIAMAFGARLAGGCTSGHGISGALQLSIGSWISAICFFIGGIAAAMLIFAT